jgi:hypothetical protein
MIVIECGFAQAESKAAWSTLLTATIGLAQK